MAEDLALTLERLADEAQPVRVTDLSPLSDVPRNQVPLFGAAWVAFSPERRLELIQALVEQAETNIHLNFFAILREMLHDPEAQIRKLAIEGLWEDNRPALVVPLVQLALDDETAAVRAAAAMALGRFVLLGVLGEIPEGPAAQAAEALWAIWRRGNEPIDVRRRALEGLAYLNQPDVRELIRAAYYEEDALLRQSAVFAMGRSAEQRWSRFVLEGLHGRDAAMRFEAATAAGELALAAAVNPLVQLLDDGDSSVREAAAAALGQIGGPVAKRALQAATDSPVESLALAAEAALEELNFNRELPEVVPGMAVLGSDDDEFLDEDFGDLDGLASLDDEMGDFAEDDVDWTDEDDDLDDEA